MKTKLLFCIGICLCLNFQIIAQRITLPNGTTPFFSGINVAWRNYGGDCADTPINVADWTKVLDDVKAAGGNTVRWWLFVNASQVPKFTNGYVSGLGTHTIINVKAVLDLALERNIMVIPCLLSFDMMQTNQWGVNEANNKRMLQTDAGIKACIDNAIVPLATAIGNHPSLLCWEIFNEPEGMTEFGWTPARVAMTDIQKFVNRAAGAIHTAVSGVKVSNGSWNMKVLCNILGHKNYYSDAELRNAGGVQNGTLDFYMVHYYNNDGGDNTHHSPFHHNAAYWGLNKPIIVAEYSAHGFTNPNVSITECYRRVYEGNYAGALSWTYTNHDGHGGLADATPGLTYLKNTYPLAINLELDGDGGGDDQNEEECPQFVNTLVNKRSNAQAIALKHYLDSVYANTNNRLAGQMDDGYVPYIYEASGKYPAIIGYDFDGICPSQTKGNKDADKAIRWVKDRGGIAQFSWHWISPDANGDYYTSNFNLANALADPNSQSYKNIIRDMDLAAAQLKKLQDSGVAVLWRPLHEAEGGWFWWGRSGGAACQTLYRLMYDRFTNVHNLNNLIWVWTSYGSKYQNWYPGDDVVDMIVWDYPAAEGGANAWNQYQTLFGNKGKLFAIGEEGAMADPSSYDTQSWLYFLTWAYMILDPKDDSRGTNTRERINQIYNSPRVITLDKLPDWKSYGPCKSTARPNVALHKKVTVSSTETGNNVASNITDGDKTTRWASVYADPQWVLIDLEYVYIISEISLFWETAYGSAYRIEVSENGTAWAQVYATTTGNGGTDKVTFTPRAARYVRISGTARATAWGYSLYEVEVYQANLALKKPVAVSSTEAGFGNIASNMNDSLKTTRWSSVYSNAQWFTIDLQQVYTIDRMRILWEAAYGSQYTIAVSVDSISWTSVFAESAGNGGVDAVYVSDKPARYVRWQGVQRATAYGYSIFEFEVYGKKYVTPQPLTQTIALQKGWNLISISVVDTDGRYPINHVFSGKDVKIVKNADGFWKPNQPDAFNSIQTIEPGKGYLVNMNTAGTITISGIPYTGELLFAPTGWQLIGYPCTGVGESLFAPRPISNYFNTTNCQIIKNFDGFWVPNGTMNSIQNFEVGKGYFVKF